MGGCADREDKFGKKRKISDLQALQEFEKEEKAKTSRKSNEKSHSFQHHFDKIHSKQSKTQENESDEEESSEESGTKQPPRETNQKLKGKSLNLTFSIDRQLDSEATLVSPTIKCAQNSLDRCESVSILNKKSTEKPVFLDFHSSLTIPADPSSCIHEKLRKKTVKILDRCLDLTIKPPKIKNKLKIVKIAHEFCKPIKPQKPVRLVINSGSRPGSPEPENRLIFLSFHKFSSLRVKDLNRLPEQPDIDCIRREKVIKSLSSQTAHIEIISPKLRKVANKEISTDLTSLEVSYNRSSESSDKVLERRISDLMTPASPLSPFEVFSSERLSIEENSKPSYFESISEIHRSSYRRATENREYIRRDSLQQMEEIPEELSKKPEYRRLSTRISELGLREAKNQAVQNKTRFFRRGLTLNNF